MVPYPTIFGKESEIIKEKKLNMTATTLSIIYSIVLYYFLTKAPPGEAPDHPLWVFSLMPAGVVVILFFFKYIIKKDFLRDFFDKNE